MFPSEEEVLVLQDVAEDEVLDEEVEVLSVIEPIQCPLSVSEPRKGHGNHDSVLGGSLTSGPGPFKLFQERTPVDHK